MMAKTKRFPIVPNFASFHTITIRIWEMIIAPIPINGHQSFFIKNKIAVMINNIAVMNQNAPAGFETSLVS